MNLSELYAKEPERVDSHAAPRKPAQRARTSDWQTPPAESPIDRYDRLLRAHRYCERCAHRPLFLWFDLIGFSLICIALAWALASLL